MTSFTSSQLNKIENQVTVDMKTVRHALERSMSAENVGRSAARLWTETGKIGRLLFFSAMAVIMFLLVKTALDALNPISQQERDRRKKAAQISKTIKEAMPNPDLLVWERIRANSDASVVCLEYQITNGSGGINRDKVVFVNDMYKQSRISWETYCTSSTQQ